MLSPEKFSSFVQNLLKNEGLVEEKGLLAAELERDLAKLKRKIASFDDGINEMQNELPELEKREACLITEANILKLQSEGAEEALKNSTSDRDRELKDLETMRDTVFAERRNFCDAVMKFSEVYGLTNFVREQYQTNIRRQIRSALSVDADDASEENEAMELKFLESTLEIEKANYEKQLKELNNLNQLNNHLDMEFSNGSEFVRLRNELNRMRRDILQIQNEIQSQAVDEINEIDLGEENNMEIDFDDIPLKPVATEKENPTPKKCTGGRFVLAKDVAKKFSTPRGKWM